QHHDRRVVGRRGGGQRLELVPVRGDRHGRSFVASPRCWHEPTRRRAARTRARLDAPVQSAGPRATPSSLRSAPPTALPPPAPPRRPGTQTVRAARRNGLRLAIAGVAVVALAGAAVGLKALLTPPSPPVAAGCEVRSGSLTYDLSLDQAANAATITAVGK